MALVNSITTANLPYPELNKIYRPPRLPNPLHTILLLSPLSPIFPFMSTSNKLGHVEQGDYVTYWSSRWKGHIHQGDDVGHGIVVGFSWSGVGRDRISEVIISKEDHLIVIIPIHKCQKANRPESSN